MRCAVAAGEACVRLRSSRKSRLHDLSDVPRTLILRLLRSRTQASPAATETAFKRKKPATWANADQLGKPRRHAFLVAATEGGVRLRSSRKSGLHDLSDVPRTLILRLLRSRTQATPAATHCVVA